MVVKQGIVYVSQLYVYVRVTLENPDRQCHEILTPKFENKQLIMLNLYVWQKIKYPAIMSAGAFEAPRSWRNSMLRWIISGEERSKLVLSLDLAKTV